VDAAGNVNGGCGGVEDRISFFAGLGEAIIARYHRSITEGKSIVLNNFTVDTSAADAVMDEPTGFRTTSDRTRSS
jgi:hypothetical protein